MTTVTWISTACRGASVWMIARLRMHASPALHRRFWRADLRIGSGARALRSLSDTHQHIGVARYSRSFTYARVISIMMYHEKRHKMYHLYTELETVAHDRQCRLRVVWFIVYTDTTHRSHSSSHSQAMRQLCRARAAAHAVHARPTAVLLSAPRHPWADLPWKSAPPAAVPNDDLQSTRRRCHRRPRLLFSRWRGRGCHHR
jgi:hypothetical protein